MQLVVDANVLEMLEDVLAIVCDDMGHVEEEDRPSLLHYYQSALELAEILVACAPQERLESSLNAEINTLRREIDEWVADIVEHEDELYS